jgi:citrate synthase
LNTAACKSRITFIDGDRGVLEYRGPTRHMPNLQLTEAEAGAIVAFLASLE